MSPAHRASVRAFVLLTLLAFASIPLNAQTVTGTMNGTVTDRTGAALPGVTLTIRNAQTGLERVVVTTGAGNYSAPFLPLGVYDVVAELTGFGSMRRNNVRIDLNQTAVQDFVLDPAVTETVTVSADAPRIDVSDGEVKQTMRSQEIMSLPSADQASFNRLAATFSGYEENPTNGQDNPALSSGSSVNFNGTGTRGATFQINGVNNDDSSENQHRQNVPLATIQSFQILTNNFSAEFGRGYGAVVLVQTKQGTNSVDGELYGYGQDNKYIARDTLQVSLQHPKHYRRQFGVAAGFPILKDKLFGFVNDHQVQDKGGTLVTRGVFLASDLDPAKRLTLGNDTPANRAWQDGILARFPGNTPNATNLNSRAYQGFQQADFPDKDFSGRLDYNATLNNTFTARYQKSHQIRVPGELIVGEAANQDNHESNVGVTWTSILSSNTVQEARYGLGLRNVAWTVTGGNSTPVVRFSGTGLTFTILGNAGAFPIVRNQRDNQFVYNFSTAHWARHTLKLGTDIRKSELDDRADNFNRGFWSFGATCNGVNYGTGLAAFWAGCVSSFTTSYGPNYLQHSLHEANVYGQDDWRPMDNLVLNLGIRYENVSAPKVKHDLVDYQYKTSDYIDPRLGFAYTPDWDSNRFLRAMTGGNGKFSIRGGFGIFHGRVFQSVFSQGGASVRYNPPNAATLGFTSTNLADPTNGFVFVPGSITAVVSPTFIDPNLKMPESRQWNLTFERQIFWNSRFRASYIGTQGRNLLQYRFSNAAATPAPPGTAGAQWLVAQDWRCAGTGTVAGVNVNATCPNVVPIAPNEVSLRVTRLQARRPDQRYSDVRIVNNGAASWYHAGQLEWETGEHKGFLGRMTYTFSKAIDTGSESTFVGTGDINAFPPLPGAEDTYNRGLSRFDTRHRFTATGAYQFPWLLNRNDFVSSAFGGWALSTSIRLSSGTPFTVVDTGAPDIFFLGATMQPFRPVCTQKGKCGGYHINARTAKEAGQLNNGAFRHAQYGDQLSDFVGRNTFYTDGADYVDMGLYKTFKMPANTALMLRLDVFNLFNHVTWWYPNNDFNSATFGVENTTNYTPRTLQLGFRLMF